MKAVAHRSSRRAFTHQVDIRQHHLTADEPIEEGGEDTGPSPQELLAASLASCTAVTIEMYAARKGWDVGAVEVECEYAPADRESPTSFTLVLRLPAACSPDQIERLSVIAAKCPVHRTLEGEVSFEQHVELVEPNAPLTASPRAQLS
ncbi:MAG TPA: OsmC family protein [Solirubrobacteraceae bacterium]